MAGNSSVGGEALSEQLLVAPERALTAPEPHRPTRSPADQPLEEAAPARSTREVLTGPVGVVLVAVVAGIAATVFASHHDLMLLYADARSHLTIARRLVDGSNHGIVQLGTVWLPLPHLLLAPFTMVGSLWHTGMAAIPIDLACLAIEALSVYAIVRVLGGGRVVAWIGVLALVTNPSILYLHTTALTEPVLYAALLGTTATLARWATRDKAYSGGEIAVHCGLPATAAVLARYDGWAFVAAACVFVFVVAWKRWRSARYAFHITRCFATLPAIGALWWMWFNWVNFGDPLEFQRGRYSAQAQQALLARQGKLPDQHDLLRSLGTYTTSVVRGAGWILVVLGVAGMIAWAFHRRTSASGLAPWLLVLVPFGFYVGSLYTGQIAVRLDQTATDSMFNLRYGVEMVPGLVVFTALLVVVIHERVGGARVMTGVAVVVLALVAVQAAAWWPDWRSVPAIEEGFAQRAAGRGQYAAGEWLHDHATNGAILLDDSINPLLPVVDADLSRVIAPFSGRSWRRALQDPSRAQWVFVDRANPDDAVRRAVDRSPTFHDDFVRRFRDGPAEVYERRSDR